MSLLSLCIQEHIFVETTTSPQLHLSSHGEWLCTLSAKSDYRTLSLFSESGKTHEFTAYLMQYEHYL